MEYGARRHPVVGSQSGAGAVRAVSVTVAGVGVVVDKVKARPLRSVGELRVGGVNTRVDDVDVNPLSRSGRPTVDAIEGCGALVDAIETPESGVDGGGGDVLEGVKHDIALDVLDVVGEGGCEVAELFVVLGAKREEARSIDPTAEASTFESPRESVAAAGFATQTLCRVSLTGLGLLSFMKNLINIFVS